MKRKKVFKVRKLTKEQIKLAMKALSNPTTVCVMEEVLKLKTYERLMIKDSQFSGGYVGCFGYSLWYDKPVKLEDVCIVTYNE